MFPTFTGNSRRPRNVNLSGQKTVNPWSNSAWSPATSGASQTVALAQAEREKRQREREELGATKKLQRVWRGHKQRKDLKDQRRQELDALYHRDPLPNPRDRLRETFSLLLFAFDPSRSEDQLRLDRFIHDIAETVTSTPEYASALPLHSWYRLAGLLVGALEKRPPDTSQQLLGLLVEIIKRWPSSVSQNIQQYYRLLTRYFKLGNSTKVPRDDQLLLFEAVAGPLKDDTSEGHGLDAYRAFAFNFLTASDLKLFEGQPGQLARLLNLPKLSLCIVDAFSSPLFLQQSPKDGLLWLLSHFIALNQEGTATEGSLVLKALFVQLAFLAADIRLYSEPKDERNEDEDNKDATDKDAIHDNPGLPPYIRSQFDFLVNEDGVAALLANFTSHTNSTDDASLLAGYTLLLLRCFPTHGDDIKMRLFQGDIVTTRTDGAEHLPSVQYFWRATAKTDLFKSISGTRNQSRPASIAALLQPNEARDQEWRTILLFLELYNFLLRVTDDEDFFISENDIVLTSSQALSRSRLSGLDLSALEQLVQFLKNLCFTLYYNLADILPSSSRLSRLDTILGVGPPQTLGRESDEKPTPSAFAGIEGMDVLALRSTSTIAMRSLYERDSRRRFLQKDFWLMTSKFDMDGFISAVVLEEQRQDQISEDNDDEQGEADRDTLNSFHTFSGHRISRAAQIERHRQLRRIQRDQLLAQVGPKLEVLRNMPFAIPFEVRVQIFRQFVHLDKQKRRGGNVDPDRWRLAVMAGGGQGRGDELLGRHTARIKRGEVFDDAYDAFYSLGEGLKEPIQITFVDQFDQPEAGIDGGGVTKEFLTSVTAEAFSPEADGHRLFVSNSQNLLYPNPTAFDERMEVLRSFGYQEGAPEWTTGLQDLSRRYEFLGRIVGKCMYEGILVDIAFANFFLLKWSASGQSTPADYRASLNDLRDLDPELYQGLISLKNYPGDVADLSLDFTINDQVVNPTTGEVTTMTRPLRKDGENIPVTNKDRPLYISYVAHHRLVAQPYRQTRAFLRGLGSIINPAWLSMFNQSELQRLVGGDSSEIDVEDLRRNTIYSGLYAIGDDGQEHPTIKLFWQVMHGLRDAERREVLKYVTSTPRAPLLGFAQLNPHFSIRDAGHDEERLPSTSTCVNLLKLPQYTSAETMRSKLLYAVQSGAGFDLS